MSKVTAIIHLRQHSVYAPCRVGQFLRPDGQTLHLWLGKELNAAEFNLEWPKAVKSTNETVHVKLVERPDDVGPDAISKEEHEAKLTAIQAAVNEFTAQCNAKLEAKDAYIATLEAQIPLADEICEPSDAKAAESVVEPVAESVAETVNSTTTDTPSADSAPAPSDAKAAQKAAKADQKAAKAAQKE